MEMGRRVDAGFNQVSPFHRPRRPLERVELCLYSILTSALEGVTGQRHAPAGLYPRERPGTHCTRGWVSLRAGLDRCGKFRPHRDSILGPSRP